MIVTLTMNPCIDLNMEVEAIEFENPLRATLERKRAGGKGINVSDALSILGVPSIAVAPIGGPGGAEFADLAKRRLKKDLIHLQLIEVEGNTRTNTVITSTTDSKHIKVNQQGPLFTPEMLATVVNRLDEMITKGDVLALCGSLPKGVEPNFYADLVRRYREQGIFVVVDADGEALREAIKQKPHLVKPNRDELALWRGTPINDDETFAYTAQQLVTLTEGLCLASDGDKKALFASKFGIQAIQPVKVAGSPVGAGDCALAGCLAGLTATGSSFTASEDQTTLQEAFFLAVCCGTASASTPDTESFDLERLESIKKATARPAP